MEKNQHLAIASVPVQEWNEVYDEAHALRKGTIFGELNRPFFATVLDDETLAESDETIKIKEYSDRALVEHYKKLIRKNK